MLSPGAGMSILLGELGAVTQKEAQPALCHSAPGQLTKELCK